MRPLDRHPSDFRLVTLPGAAVVVLALAAVGAAAPDAGAKARGQFNFYGSSTHNAFSSARSHVSNYQTYLSETHGVAMPRAETIASAPGTAPQRPVVVSRPGDEPARGVEGDAVDPEIAREASDAIADDIERIQRHLKSMQAQAKSSGDAKILAEIADVDKQLGIARRGHAALHDHHASETISPAKAMDLAEKVNAALRAAHAEHDEVMKLLAAPATR